MPESEEEKRERVMRRLAEILRGPPPTSGTSTGPVAAGSIEAAIAALGLGLSSEDTEQVADAVREGPDPEQVARLLHALLEGFERRNAGRPEEGEGT